MARKKNDDNILSDEHKANTDAEEFALPYASGDEPEGDSTPGTEAARPKKQAKIIAAAVIVAFFAATVAGSGAFLPPPEEGGHVCEDCDDGESSSSEDGESSSSNVLTGEFGTVDPEKSAKVLMIIEGLETEEKANEIYQALMTTASLGTVSCDLSKGSFEVEFDSEVHQGEKIVELVRAAGHTVVSFE